MATYNNSNLVSLLTTYKLISSRFGCFGCMSTYLQKRFRQQPPETSPKNVSSSWEYLLWSWGVIVNYCH